MSFAERGGARPVVGAARPPRFAVQAAVEHAYNRLLRSSGRAEPSVVVLGNQKAGTSFVAAAIGRALDVDYQIDLPIERYDPTHRRRDPTADGYADHLLDRSRRRVASPVVKEPSLTFWWRQMANRWPAARIVVVVRDPLDNIRSTLDRLDLLAVSGDPARPLPPVPYPWLDLLELADTPDGRRPVATLDEVVANLGRRWTRCAEAAVAASAAGHDVIRYEDLRADLTGSLASLGLPPAPQSVLEQQHQPAGRNRHGRAADLLAPWASELLSQIAPLAARFGYSADRRSAPIRRIPEPNNPLDLAPRPSRRATTETSLAGTRPDGVVELNDPAGSSGKGAWT